MSVQEVMHQLLPLKFFSSLFHVVMASLDGSRRVEFTTDEIITELSQLDSYAMKETFSMDHQ